MATERCLTCSEPIHGMLYSISHTVKPGVKLCLDCGRRESTDPAWASGMRLGILRGEAATDTLLDPLGR
jgi:hypothetical protein